MDERVLPGRADGDRFRAAAGAERRRVGVADSAEPLFMLPGRDTPRTDPSPTRPAAAASEPTAPRTTGIQIN